jgi:hypothetical protein
MAVALPEPNPSTVQVDGEGISGMDVLGSGSGIWYTFRAFAWAQGNGETSESRWFYVLMENRNSREGHTTTISLFGPKKKKTKLNSMVWDRVQTIPTERPPLVGEVIANLCGQKVPRGQRNGSLRPYSLGFLDRSRYFSIK